MEKEKLEKIIEKHNLLVCGKDGGECANLRGADLSGANRRATCKARNKLGYCNVPDNDCPKCKVHDYEPLDLIFGLTWKDIQAKQHKTKEEM